MNGPVAGAQTIQRAAALLREVGNSHREGIRLIDLAERAGLERPTAHRMVKSLVAEGLISQDTRSKRYFLGVGVLALGFAVTRKFDFKELARPLLDALARETGDTYYLNLRVGPEALCLVRTDGICPVRDYSIGVGERRPLGVGAGGLAILCALPAAEQEAVIRANERELTRHKGLNARALKELVSRSRALGYAFMDVKGIAGVQAVGLPIVHPRYGPIAALSVASVPGRFGTDRRELLLELLRSRVRQLEALALDQTW